MTANRSLFIKNLKQGIVLDIFIIIALVSLIIGISSPLLTLQKLYFLENQVSLISAVGQLYAKREWLLFFIIGGFSLCLPFIKILSLASILHIPHQGNSFLDKLLQGIEAIGKWSMLDVFVVALLLVSVKLGALVQVTVHEGVYFFALSVLLTMIASFWIGYLAKCRDRLNSTL